MTNAQKQSLILFVTQANGNLVRLISYPNAQFEQEVDRLILTLQAFKKSSRPHINSDEEEDV
jgi:hypothetical protein